MKLVFYSEILAGNPLLDRAVFDLIGKKSPKIGYIPSSSDKERKYYNEIRDYYQRYGISELFYFDLDQEFDRGKIRELEECDAIHLSGGNTYRFLYHIRRRDFIPFLRNYAERGKVLIGVSAGGMIMTPTIVSTTLFEGDLDDANDVGIKDFSALDLVRFEFFPHFGDAGKEEKVKEYSKKTSNFIYACEDGTGIIVDDKKATFWPPGGPKCFWKGKLVDFSKLP